MNNVDSLHFGANGSVTETGTTAITGNFFAIQTLTDTVFSLYTDALATGDAITALTIPAGVTQFGHITAFTLTSGSVRAYKK